jgi:hypothetical protein
MPRFSRLVNCDALIAACFGILVIGITLHHLGVATQEPAVTIVTIAVPVACLGASVFCLAKMFRKVGRVLGVVCFKSNRCIALDDITLIYIEPEKPAEKDAP